MQGMLIRVAIPDPRNSFSRRRKVPPVGDPSGALTSTITHTSDRSVSNAALALYPCGTLSKTQLLVEPGTAAKALRVSPITIASVGIRVHASDTRRFQARRGETTNAPPRIVNHQHPRVHPYIPFGGLPDIPKAAVVRVALSSLGDLADQDRVPQVPSPRTALERSEVIPAINPRASSVKVNCSTNPIPGRGKPKENARTPESDGQAQRFPDCSSLNRHWV